MACDDKNWTSNMRPNRLRHIQKWKEDANDNEDSELTARGLPSGNQDAHLRDSRQFGHVAHRHGSGSACKTEEQRSPHNQNEWQRRREVAREASLRRDSWLHLTETIRREFEMA